jgi:hypothetical protein
MAMTPEEKKAKDKIRLAAYYQANKERLIAKQKLYSEQNKEKVKKSRKKYYESNKEVFAIKMSEYVAKNKIKVKERKDAWRKANQEYVNAKNRNWKEKNKDKVKAQNLSWRQENSERLAAYTARYRAAQDKRTPKWLTEKDYKKIEQIYIKARKLEQKTGIQHHVDHIIPMRGKLVSGLHVPANLRVVTAKENLSKNNQYHVN